MIIKSYRDSKNHVLELYDEFAKMCEACNKEVKSNISKQADQIRAEIFNLMVVGEAKSGKSTFINAFIGDEVLPMDVRQCTSAIIKIHRGSEYKLIATTAAGGKSTINGIDNIREFLEKHAAISDKYRNIPVTTINNEVLIHYKDKPIPDRDLRDFLGKRVADNIFNININEYNKLIREYIAANKKQWGKIITEIDITYPLPEDMQGITLVDSPGVGAGGNVGAIAENYISNANAIIFVKSLTGQALETSTFMDFLRSNCTEQKRENLFLILTGTSNLSGVEVKSLNQQALDMYGRDISPDKIVCVDSKIQLFLNKCLSFGSEEAIDQYFDDLEQKEMEFPPALNHWNKSRGNLLKFQERMGEASNFDQVHRLIEEYCQSANYLRLIEFLDNILQECLRYQKLFVGQKGILQENYADPEKLADRIKEKQEEIQKTYNKMSAGVQEIFVKYTDNLSSEGLLVSEIETYRAKYENQLENFKNLPEDKIKDSTFAELKTITMSAIQGSVAFRREMANRIIVECNEKLIQCIDDTSSISCDEFSPNFTAQEFDEINKKAKQDTSGEDEIEEGLTFKRIEKVPYYHRKNHVQQVVNSISGRLDDIVGKLKDNLMAYIKECREVYKAKLTEHYEELKKSYDELLASQEDNEKTKAQMDVLQNKLDIIAGTMANMEEMRKELEQYVK